MNIFLTGQIQVGKSTIINKFLDKHPNLKIGGFKTISNFDDNLGVYGGVYIVPADKQEFIFNESNHVGNRVQGPKAIPETFNLKGCELLSNLKNYDLILMDEIGFMETEATSFCNSIMNTLNQEIPVIGVVKPMMKGLPLDVKKHEKTKLLEITVENRETKYLEFEKLVEKELN